MKKYRKPLLAACALASLSAGIILSSCSNPYKSVGMFSEISKEIKLRDASVKGNILAMMEAGDYIYAVGGNIFRKHKNTGRAWEGYTAAGLPGRSQIRRLAVGYDAAAQKEVLYALRMWTEGDYDDIFRATLYFKYPDEGEWKEANVTGTTGSITQAGTLITNRAKDPAGRNAYLVTDSGAFKLECANGTVSAAITTANNASASSRSVARLGGADWFSPSLAFCANADETMLYEIQGSLKYTTDGNTWNDSGIQISDTKSLVHSSKDRALYYGQAGGNRGVHSIVLNADGSPAATAELGGNTYAAVGNYDVYCVYAENSLPADGSETSGTLYAGIMARSTAISSKFNGLWGRYTDSRTGAEDLGNWNRE